MIWKWLVIAVVFCLVVIWLVNVWIVMAKKKDGYEYSEEEHRFFSGDDEILW